MPSSCGSDSSPSLIPSLRNFRFQNKKPYIPISSASSSPCENSPSISLDIIPETPDSQKPGSSRSNQESIETESKAKPSTSESLISSNNSSPTLYEPSSPTSYEQSSSTSYDPSSPISSVKKLKVASTKKSKKLCVKKPKVSSGKKPRVSSAKKSVNKVKAASGKKSKTYRRISRFSSDESSSQSEEKIPKAESPLFIQRIAYKVRQTLSKHSFSDTTDLKLNLREIHRFKTELSRRCSDIGRKWNKNVTELDSSADDKSSETTLKINHPYLKELLDIFNDPFIVSPAIIPVNSNLSSSRKTYTRVKNAPSSAVSNSVSSTINSESSKLNILADVQKQLAMDDYEVFCEKETSLRQLLDAFPGADIMEAQDILVGCKWDLEKAKEVALKKPLRTTRKRLPGFTPHAEAKRMNHQNDGTNVSGNNQSSRIRSAEEIVLDSSDEDTNHSDLSTSNKMLPQNSKPKSVSSTSNQPPSKKAKRAISSSSSTEEDDPPLPRSSVQNNASNANAANQINNSQKSIVQQSLSVKTVPTQNTNNQSAKQTVSTQNINNKVTKPAPSPTVTAQNFSKQVVKPAQTQPTAAQNIKPTPTNQPVKTQNAKPTVTQSVSINKDQDTKSTAKEQPSVPSSTASMSINSIPNLPKGLVITQIQAPSNSQPSSNDKNVSSAEHSSMSISSAISAVQSCSSVSITPANINLGNNITIKPTGAISITPAISSSVSINPTNDAPQILVKENSSKGKAARARTKKYDSEEEDDEEYGNDEIYDSEDSDCEENLTAAHSAVLSFFQDATSEELATIPGCSKKKVDVILSIRPFKKWADLVEKLKNDKTLSPDLLNGAKKVIDMRNAISRLMAKCQQISLDMEDLVEDLKENKETSSDYVSTQPELLNDKMHLTSYQMLGLNWLLLMHNQEVNGILADEMGLGKTVQAIAFLAYLKQVSISGPHLIVVPSSTLDNWKKELHIWWPMVSVICYHGSQDSRRELRMQILNDEIDEFDVMVTTYNMVTSSAEDRNFFKRLEFHYVVFDEAHMLKNMASQRYQNLMRIRAPRRLLLTGTPLQNNLVELMSLLIFAMPHMFSGKTEQIKQMFSCVCKSEDGKSSFERDRIEHAKRIMKPFVLRRLKVDVLKELPPKHEEIKFCPLSEDQSKKYHDLVTAFSEEVQNNKEKDIATSSGSGMMMQLRRAANHPLLLRHHYDDDKLLEMSKLMIKEPTHTQADPNIIFEDMAVMHDFELHKLCKTYKSLESFVLPDEVILNSGKFKILENMLPKLIEEDHRILLFSQFTMVLDIVQEYMNIKDYKYLRLDGQVPVTERQQLIDDFNTDPDIAVFLLSTRAGGLGINLTAADTVILHDIDFNPYNDKQAEDRCHRVGQMRDVRVVRLVSEDTIEEGILQRAKEKLKLERDIHAENETEENDIASVAKLLRDALGLTHAKS